MDTTTDRTDKPAPVAEPLAFVKHLRGEGFTVVDATSHESLARVGAGRQPNALAVHPGGRWGYVPYMGSNTLEVVDLWMLDVTARLHQDRIGTAPVGAALTRTGEHLFVSCYGSLPDDDSPGLAVFETTDRGSLTLVAGVPVGKAGGVVVDVRNDVWVALKDENEVVRLTGTPPFEEVDRFAVPGDPQDMAYAAAYGLLGVNNVDDGSVTFIDTLAGEPRGTVPAPNPRGGTAVPAADRWFVGDTEDDGVTAIDVTAVRADTDAESDRIADAAERVTLGTPTAFTDATPDGTLLAIDASEDDRVTFLDPATLDVVARVRTGEAPHHPRFSADGRVCYVPNTDADTLTVLDTRPLREGDGRAPVVATIDFPEGSGPSGCFRTDRREFL
jgi:protein NirF